MYSNILHFLFFTFMKTFGIRREYYGILEFFCLFCFVFLFPLSSIGFTSVLREWLSASEESLCLATVKRYLF